MSRRKIHRNSREAYAEGRLDLFPRRTREILAVFEGSKHPLTDRQVMEKLGKTDPNAVRPRITELVDAGVLKEEGSINDLATGKRVRFCSIALSVVQKSLL